MDSVYVFRIGEGPAHRLGKTKRETLQRGKEHGSANPEPLTLVREYETERYSKCEAFLKRTLESKRIQGKTEVFILESADLDSAFEAMRAYDANLAHASEIRRLSRTPSEPVVVTATDEHQAVYERLREIEQQIDILAFEREQLQTGLKLVIGSASALGEIVTWKSHPKGQFDGPRFKREQPELHCSYSKSVTVRKFVLR